MNHPKPGNDLDLGVIVGTRRVLRMPANSRQSHLHVVGATGVGKSKFLEAMIREDIRSHYHSGCGLLLIDRHGDLYDGIVAWLARFDREARLPVVPIDLRRDDHIIAYNLLRPQKAKPSVVAANVVDAVAHVWGAPGVLDTPRFAHVARLIVRTLYENHLTLAEAPDLLHPGRSTLRAALGLIAQELDRHKWAYIEGLSPSERFTLFESSVNRFDPFVQNNLLCAMVGQTGPSLDLGRAMRRGYILLVAAPNNALVAPEDARMLGTLMLSDLWLTASQRRKGESLRPLYLYLDEFQEFVTPTIAKSLDQARGFGLHLTLAHQFPSQLTTAGPHGPQLYHSVMVNGRNKVVFHLSHDLDDITRTLFLGTLDSDEVKHRLYSTRVVGQREETRTTYTRNETLGSNAGTSKSVELREDDETGRANEGQNTIDIDTVTHGEAEGTVMIQEFEKELASLQYRSIEEQLARSQRILFDQKQRQCMVRLAESRVPIALYTPTVEPSRATPRDVERYLEKRYRRCKFCLTAAEAEANRKAKRERIDAMNANKASDEPDTARRKYR